MKKVLLIYLILSAVGLNAQSISEINTWLGISDSLSNKEIRIYKRYSTTTSTELFRFYKTDKSTWSTKLYHFRSDRNTFDETDITPKNNLEYLWLQFYIINIDKLKSINEIDYKIQKKKIVFDEEYGYGIETNKLVTTDGIEYTLYYRNQNATNTVQFNNYETYLKQSPDVDELNAYDEIIKLVKNNFNIWP